MSSHPRFGLAIPNCREGLYYPPSFAGPRAMLDTGIMAEELGYDSVWVNDHFTAPKYVENIPRIFITAQTVGIVINCIKSLMILVELPLKRSEISRN